LGSIRTLVIAIVVVACAPAPPSPQPSAGATVAPPASPSVDLSAALREILRAPGPYRMRMDRRQSSETTTSRIVGTMRVTPGAWAAEGTRTDQAVGSSTVAEATYEMIWIGDSGYTRTDGPWIPFVGLFDHPLRLTADPDAGDFVQTGQYARNDRTVFQLGYADPAVIDPVYVLAIGNELEDVEASVTYELTAEGALVGMSSSLIGRRLEQFGGGSITHKAEYSVIAGFPEPIVAPATEWELYRSEALPLSLALPPGWSAEVGADGLERLRGPDGVARIRVREDPMTSSRSTLVDDIRSEYRELGVGEASSVVPTYLGAEVATAVIYPNVDLGSGRVNVVHLVSAHHGVVYDIVWTMQPGVLQRQYDMIGDVATSWFWGRNSAAPA
jgi:hypothetical protein